MKARAGLTIKIFAPFRIPCGIRFVDDEDEAIDEGIFCFDCKYTNMIDVSRILLITLTLAEIFFFDFT